MMRTHILRFIETGLSCSCLEQLGWFAGRNPKDCTVGYITENPPVPSTLGFGGWWRSERSNFLALYGWRWSCLNFWLLSCWGLNLLGREKCRASLWGEKKRGEEMEKKSKPTPKYNNTPFAHIRFEWLRLSSQRKPRQQPSELLQRLTPPRPCLLLIHVQFPLASIHTSTGCNIATSPRHRSYSQS